MFSPALLPTHSTATSTFFLLIPHSRVVITEGSHLEMYDDQERYFREVVKFIKDVEAGKMK